MLKKNNKKPLIPLEVPYHSEAEWIPMEDMSHRKQNKYQYNK